MAVNAAASVLYALNAKPFWIYSFIVRSLCTGRHHILFASHNIYCVVYGCCKGNGKQACGVCWSAAPSAFIH